MKKLLAAPITRHLIAPVALWLMLWLWWGDVLWCTAENSYFGHGGSQMHFLWQQPYGSLWIAGRALLTTCHTPWLGAAVLTLILTACAVLLRYTFRLRWGQEWVAVAAYLVWMVHEGFDLYYQSEPGRLHGIALLMLVLLGVESFVLWTFRRRKKGTSLSDDCVMLSSASGMRSSRRGMLSSENGMLSLKMCHVACLLLPLLYAVWQRPYVRPVCHMERAMECNDWQEMAVTARSASAPSRPLAAYYAIALVRQDSLLNRLFDIEYRYREISLHDRNGASDIGHNYIMADCNLHSGLLQACYHTAMETLTMQGPSVHMLKRLCQVAVMRGEVMVAEKYLTLLGREPMMGTGWVEHWRRLNRDHASLEADPLVQSIRRLEPVHDSFEKDYAAPVFLGFPMAMIEGRSAQALDNCLAVCLYSKKATDFMQRVPYMEPQRMISKPVVMDALALMSAKNPQLLEMIPPLRANASRYQKFLQDMRAIGATGDTEARKPYAGQMFESWPGYFPTYYYFGNLDATVPKANDAESGVN